MSNLTTHQTPPDLLIVMPAFNEEEAIAKVVGDWFYVLDQLVGNFLIWVVDDGSTDQTLDILLNMHETLGSRLEVYSRPNKGHGQSCIEGYRLASTRGIPFVLQVDSDGQCDPAYFRAFWDLRNQFDVIYGQRTREDGIRRIVASQFLRIMLASFFQVKCVDPNVPYRLMRTETCEVAFDHIPTDFFLANVALAYILRKDPQIRHGVVPIRFRERCGGEPSVPFSKFAVKARELFQQLRKLKIAQADVLVQDTAE